MTLQEQIDAKRHEIYTEGYPMSIGELSNLYRDGELDIHPEFQRFFRWSDLQKSKLIESLLLGIPIPSIFVSQRSDGVWDVIDGVQRLSTIFQFMGILRDHDGMPVEPLVLESTEYLDELGGMTWDGDTQLEPEQQRLIKRAAIDIKIVTRESDEAAKFDLFQRLNTGGAQLSDQELRNCLLIMVDPTFYQWVVELGKTSEFQTSVAMSDRQTAEQYDLELVLRFLSLSRADADTLREMKDMRSFLDQESLKFAGDPNFDREQERVKFESTFRIVELALQDSAFRRFDETRGRFIGGFSVSSFEAISCGVAHSLQNWVGRNQEEQSAEFVARTKSLWGNEDFRNNSGSGVRASTRVSRTIPIGRELFKL